MAQLITLPRQNLFQPALQQFVNYRQGQEQADAAQEQADAQQQYQNQLLEIQRGNLDVNRGQLDVQKGQLQLGQDTRQDAQRMAEAKALLDGWQKRMDEGDATVQQEAAQYIMQHPEERQYLAGAAMYHASKSQQATGTEQGYRLGVAQDVAGGATDPNKVNLVTHDLTGSYQPPEGFKQQQATDLAARTSATPNAFAGAIPKPTGQGVTDYEARTTGALTTAPENLSAQTQKDVTNINEAGATKRTAMTLAAQKDMAANKPPAAGGVNQNDAAAIAKEIVEGRQPPTVHARIEGPVRAALAPYKYDLNKAQQDWTATQKYLATMNGSQQVRLRQAVDFAYESLPVVDDLAKQWEGSGFPILNKARLFAAKQGALGPQAQAIATKLDSQINDMQSELAVVYRGGNSPTDEALKQAQKMLNADWSLPTLRANLGLIETNLRIRRNSLVSAGVAANQGNSYAPNMAIPRPNSTQQQNNDPLGLFK